MRNAVKMAVGLTALVAMSGCLESAGDASQVPSIGSSSDLSDFVGARAGQAEMGIQSLGFELIRSTGLTSYWFNRATGACAEITTSEGRYSSINMLPAEDC